MEAILWHLWKQHMCQVLCVSEAVLSKTPKFGKEKTNDIFPYISHKILQFVKGSQTQLATFS